MPIGVCRLTLGLLFTVAIGISHGYFLDGDRRFDVRLRAYSQLGVMMEDSAPEWSYSYSYGTNTDHPRGSKLVGRDQLGSIYATKGTKSYHVGDLAQHRNFYNPEFDAKLTDFTGGLADDFKFHFAWWGFYDGLYDYLDPIWRDNARNLKIRESQSDNPHFRSLLFQDENKNPRHIYGSRNRINELYVDYSKGPVFFRVGRQAISWGESDDIALLDVQNPYDLTLGAPGFFQDVEEARIPLWTIRNTTKLIDNMGPFSNLFVDAYLVPGPIDTTVPIDPIIGGVSPFNPDQSDPQKELNRTPLIAGTNLLRGDFLHVVTASRQPEQNWGNSRWGVRLSSLVARDYTVQGWAYRTFNQAPTPWLQGPPGGFDLWLSGDPSHGIPKNGQLIDDRGFRTSACLDPSGNPIPRGQIGAHGRTPAGRRCSYAASVLTILERRLETVFGLAATWFSPWANGIIRTEAEYFQGELATIPSQNLGAAAQVPGAGATANFIPKANYLRWVIGYDRFFFFRPVNPSNSIVASAAFHGQWNTTATFHGRDYRSPQTKPGKPPAFQSTVGGNLVAFTPDKNYQNEYAVDNLFLNVAFQTDYMHGRLTPRLVFIADVSGIFGLSLGTTYRINDNVLASLTYLSIEGPRKYALGTFRSHDMVQFRMTYQLN